MPHDIGGNKLEIVNADNKIDIMIDDAIKKCQTSAHVAKDLAGDLRRNGFDGQVIADLIEECEKALKFAHAYQSYVNTLTLE